MRRNRITESELRVVYAWLGRVGGLNPPPIPYKEGSEPGAQAPASKSSAPLRCADMKCLCAAARLGRGGPRGSAP